MSSKIQLCEEKRGKQVGEVFGDMCGKRGVNEVGNKRIPWKGLAGIEFRRQFGKRGGTVGGPASWMKDQDFCDFPLWQPILTPLCYLSRCLVEQDLLVKYKILNPMEEREYVRKQAAHVGLALPQFQDLKDDSEAFVVKTKPPMSFVDEEEKK